MALHDSPTPHRNRFPALTAVCERSHALLQQPMDAIAAHARDFALAVLGVCAAAPHATTDDHDHCLVYAQHLIDRKEEDDEALWLLRVDGNEKGEEGRGSTVEFQLHCVASPGASQDRFFVTLKIASMRLIVDIRQSPHSFRSETRFEEATCPHDVLKMLQLLGPVHAFVETGVTWTDADKLTLWQTGGFGDGAGEGDGIPVDFWVRRGLTVSRSGRGPGLTICKSYTARGRTFTVYCGDNRRPAISIELSQVGTLLRVPYRIFVDSACEVCPTALLLRANEALEAVLCPLPLPPSP